MCDFYDKDCDGCLFEDDPKDKIPCYHCLRNPRFIDEYTSIDDDEEDDHGQE